MSPRWTIRSIGRNQLCLDNVTVHADNNKYAETILDSGFYDLIIIDGIQRLACARNAVSHLNSGGMIVLDNSDWYEAACLELSENSNLIQINFSGFGPINNYCWSTSVFLHRDFAMPSKESSVPRPTGGLKKSLPRDA